MKSTARLIASMAFAGSLLASSIAFSSGPVRPDSAPTRWIIAYAGSVKGGIGVRYTTDDFTRLISVVDTNGKPTAWLHTGVIFIDIWAPSGRAFSTWIGGDPAVGSDWDAYVDSLSAPGGYLARLDSAVQTVTRVVGPLGHSFPVAVMVPYPDPKQDSLRFEGASYLTSATAGRISADSAFVAIVKQKVGANSYSSLRLDGFYWLSESVQPFDSAVVHGVAARIHEQGLRFLWVPYYFAAAQKNWKSLGFDEAWLQPNYFFHPEVSKLRLDSAVTHALNYGLGLEIEFNSRLLSDSTYYERLDPYLAALEKTPALHHRSIAVFDGEGALTRLSRSRTPRDRAIYRRFVQIMRGNDSTTAS